MRGAAGGGVRRRWSRARGLSTPIAAPLPLCSGDSRLFLFTVDGKVAAAVAQAKEGAIADFAWSPTDPNAFIVIAGKSPPAATLTVTRTVPMFAYDLSTMMCNLPSKG